MSTYVARLFLTALSQRAPQITAKPNVNQKKNTNTLTAFTTVSSNILKLLPAPQAILLLKVKSRFSAKRISLQTNIFWMKTYTNINSKPFIKTGQNIVQPEKGEGEGFHHLLMQNFEF